jgi:5-methylcytosine-specific restriction endonuclease McrA
VPVPGPASRLFAEAEGTCNKVVGEVLLLNKHDIPILDYKKPYRGKRQLKSKLLPLSEKWFSVPILYEMQKGLCFYCGTEMLNKPWSHKYENPWGYTKDHFLPKSKGCHIKRNMVLACYPCNCAKLDRLPSLDEMRRFKELYEII